MPRVKQSRTVFSFVMLLVGLSLLPVGLVAQGQKERRVYVFGQEDMHPQAPDHRITVWLDRMARAAGHELAAEGRSGDLRRFAFELPARPDWDMSPVARVLGPGKPGFRLAGFDTVILSPETGLMGQPPLTLFEGVNRAGHNPVTVSTMVVDWLSRFARGARVLVRQVAPEGQSAAEAALWHESYLAALEEARPHISVQGIPLYRGLPRMATVVGEQAASDPVGAAFLEALLTYGAVYAEAPPLEIDLPNTVPAPIRDALPELVRLTLPILADYPSDLTPPPLILEEGLENPALSMGLYGIWDWSPQHPFLDLMKTARVWRAHPGDGGEAVELSDLRNNDAFDQQGWPVRIPDDTSFLELLILTAQPADGFSRAGRYRLTYEGEGRLTVSGAAFDIETKPGDIRFSFVPDPGLVQIRIMDTDPLGTGAYIRNIRIHREDQLPLVELGMVFNPDWLRHVRDMRSVRFMDWMATNGSPLRTLEDRPRPDDFTYTWRGVPAEVMVDLANEIGADPWFNMPHMADDAYVRDFAQTVRDRLDPRLRAYVEYSNEIWNFIFPQTFWAQEQARERWGSVRGDGDGWMQFAGMRAAQVAQIWTDVFGADTETRLTRVLGVHSGWFGLEEPLMMAPHWVAENPEQNKPPYQYFDAYGVTGYLTLMGDAENVFPKVLSWLDQGEAFATEKLATELRDVSLAHLRDDIFPYHADVARRYGLDLVMYEGGSHLVAYDNWTQDDRLTKFFVGFSYSNEMASIYAGLLDVWAQVGGGPFNAFLDVYDPGRWGSWGHLRHLDDINPRWQVLIAHNATAPVTWEERAPGTFSHGIIRHAASDGGRVEARHPRDILLGGAGDDTLVAVGCCARLHGGGGRNVAILPGVSADYAMRWDGDTLLLTSTEGEVRVVSVQELQFAGAEGESIEVTPGILP